MVGDRYFTDVLYGNRHGMLTIRPAPFAPRGDSRVVRAARLLEDTLVARWRRRKLQQPHLRKTAAQAGPPVLMARAHALVRDPVRARVGPPVLGLACARGRECAVPG